MLSWLVKRAACRLILLLCLTCHSGASDWKHLAGALAHCNRRFLLSEDLRHFIPFPSLIGGAGHFKPRKYGPSISNCVFLMFFFHKKMFGQSICVTFTLVRSTEPPLGPPQLLGGKQFLIYLSTVLWPSHISYEPILVKSSCRSLVTLKYFNYINAHL